jgi:hypothetical protein
MEVGRRWRARCFCGAARVLVGSCVPGTERGSLYVTAAQRARCEVSRLAVVLPPSGRCACARGIYGSAYAARHIHLSSFSRSRRARSNPCGLPCPETGNWVGLRELFVRVLSRALTD